MILLDTCALIWWTLDPEQLSTKARTKCDAIISKGAAISAISLWEISVKQRRNKLTLGLPLQEYVKRLKDLGSLTIISVDEAIILKAHALRWEHRDPADRFIVATALSLNCPIVTSDERIRAFYKRAIW
ncbi:MAG: type II toxin-antitoxin system VapC family toxin [Deltaproteobacteria bacterium]|nr:type II toxin-antitoxin system VapC family toxin [Deltaproteobacteria bacterium]